MAHSDAGVKKYPSTHARKRAATINRAYISLPAVSLKGSVASFWLCADDFRSSRQDNFRARRYLAKVPNSDVPTNSIDDRQRHQFGMKSAGLHSIAHVATGEQIDRRN